MSSFGGDGTYFDGMWAEKIRSELGTLLSLLTSVGTERRPLAEDVIK